MDDDIRLSEDTFKYIEKHYDDADIFGFKLFYEDGTIQHAGGFCRDKMLGHAGWKQRDNEVFNDPYYCCHVTTSLIYIKRSVLDKLKGMDTSYKGYQFEDVDFNFRALKAGFKLLYTPGPAIHLESASKSSLPDFKEGLDANYEEFCERFFNDDEFIKEVESYPKYEQV
jgi:GT2 family glycosyltransferase